MAKFKISTLPLDYLEKDISDEDLDKWREEAEKEEKDGKTILSK